MHLLRLPTLWRRHFAAALAVLVFGIALLSTAPGLHEQLHADAHDSEHVCAVTLFADGLTPVISAVLLAVVLRVACTLAQPRAGKPVPKLAALLPPVRGPPAR